MEPGGASSPDASRAEPQSCTESDFTKVGVREQGITVLYEGTTSLVDIVFIHGIQGHPRSTWAHGPDSTKPKNKVLKAFHGRSKARASQIPPESVYWPADFLPRDFKEARVLTYGYDSHVSRFFKGAANQNNISAHGRSLLHALELHRRDDPKRPLIFMVHSLGGIILKEALRRSKNVPDGDQDLRNIYEFINAIVFFGTPHRGSSYAKMGAVAEHIVKLIGFDANGEILRDLKPDGAHLELLREEFAYMLDSRAFKVYSFQEGQGFKGANILSRKIVDDASSSLEHSVERKDYINANHMMMCRFASSDDEGYIKVKGVLSKCLGEVRKMNEKGQRELDRNLKKIRKGMNERHDQIAVAHTHTFDWIFTDPNATFIEWLQGDSGFFWINGKPGSGKSTLMKCILEDPRSRQALLTKYGTKSLTMPGFFFHDRGMNLTQKSIDGLFRSILYQIVSDIPALAIPVHEVYKMARNVEGRCEWRTTELKKALNAAIRQTQISGCIVLFIDALDEFIGKDVEIARFLKELISCSQHQSLQIRICASSRPHNVFHDMLGDSPGLAIHDWTAKDIDIYTSDRLGECKREGLEDLHREITSRAEGVFLWVRLVIEELSQALFDGEPITALMEILSGLPADLSDFYRRMIERLPSNKQTVMLQMLELLLCENIQVLRLIDLTVAITMPTSDDPSEYCSNLNPHELIKKCREMERQLRGVSGGLLQVLPEEYDNFVAQGRRKLGKLKPDWVFEPLTPQEFAYSRRKIQFLHQTAKEFVSNPSNSDIMRGNPAKQMAIAGRLRFLRLYTFLARAGKRSILLDVTGPSQTRPGKEPGLLHTRLIDQFFANARALELITGKPNSMELARFNDALCSCIGSRWLTEWVKVKPRVKLGLAVLPTSTLDLAICEGLFHYAHETISNFEADVDNPLQSPLLHLTLTATMWYWHSDAYIGGVTSFRWTKCHEFATFLLKKGENPNATVVAPFWYLAQARRPKWTPQFPESSTNEGSGWVSKTERRHEEEVMVESSVEVSLLHYALSLLSWAHIDESQADFLEMINILISHGADVNQTFSRSEWKNPEVGLSGSGPDIESALHFLLSQSAETYLAFENPISGPLWTRLITSFLAHGADPNAVDSDGNTILECALPICPPGIIESMLESGAKITKKLLGTNGAPVYKPVLTQPPDTRVGPERVSLMRAEGVLDQMRWRRPEFYTDEAREIVRSYNPHWVEIEEIREEKGLMGRISASIGWAK